MYHDRPLASNTSPTTKPTTAVLFPKRLPMMIDWGVHNVCRDVLLLLERSHVKKLQIKKMTIENANTKKQIDNQVLKKKWEQRSN